MNCFLIMTALSVWLCTSACTPDESPQPTSPPTEHPEGGGTDTLPAAGGRIKISFRNTVLTATLADNHAAAALQTLLPLTLRMSDFNGNEKVCSLPAALPVAATNPGTIRTGEIMLFGSRSLVLFYQSFTTPYSYTRLGRVENPAALDAIADAQEITLTFELE